MKPLSVGARDISLDDLQQMVNTAYAKCERSLFQELNPNIDFTPILPKAPVTLKPAAVMIPIIAHRKEPTILLTVRSRKMPDHAGEISFPGGGPKPEDQDLIATALRETHEEVGIAPHHIEVLGTFGNHTGGRGFLITPVVGLITPPVEINPCPREVEEVFEVPLFHLLDLNNHIIEERVARDIPYRMFAVPYGDGIERRHIWGLTAGILHTLAKAYDDVIKRS
ncbi:MAG: CoA pyrophosphatase [Pseudomonadota bacterium]